MRQPCNDVSAPAKSDHSEANISKSADAYPAAPLIFYFIFYGGCHVASSPKLPIFIIK